MDVADLPAVERGEGMTGQEYAYRRLRGAVMSGWLAPGASLTIRGVAERLGLSPTPVREALRRLASENAIEVLENRRLRVPDMTPGRFRELVSLRVALETHAGLRAMSHVSNRVVADMAGIDVRAEMAAQVGDLDAVVSLNHAFHRMLYEIPPDPVSMPLIESVWLQLGPFQRLVRDDLGGGGTDAHQQIIAALMARDGGALAEAIADDVECGARLAGRRHFEGGA